jgi:D-amino-acid dehydrogenase
VKFRYETRLLGLERKGGEIDEVIIADANGVVQRLKADRYLLCLGSFSRGFARELGVDLNIYPAKGYSVTLPVTSAEHSYQVSLTDDEYKLVFSRLGDRLRIAGTAELNGYDTALNLRRCEAIVRRTLELFPRMSDGRGAQFWTGLRPATPSNLPYIGRSKVGNLYLNTGHGTLGWTHSCGSGAAIADILSGRAPALDFAFTGLERRQGYSQAQATA